MLVRDDEPAVWALEQSYVGPDGVDAPTRGHRRVAPRRAVCDGHGAPARADARRSEGGPPPAAAGDARAARADLPALRRARRSRCPETASPTSRSRTRGSGACPTRTASRPRSRAASCLIADGHHRYETAVEFAARDGARPDDGRPRLDERSRGSRSSRRTGSSRAGPTSTWPARSTRPSRRRTPRSPTSRTRAPPPSSSAPSRSGSCTARRASSTSSSSTGSGTTASRTRPTASRPSAGVESGDADCALLLRPTRIEDVFERARSGDVHAAEDDVLLPEARLGPPDPPGRPVSDVARVLPRVRRPTSTPCSPSCRPAPSASPCSARARAETTRPRSTRPPRRSSSRRLEALGRDLTLVSEELGVRAFGAGGAAARRRRPDRRLRQREARRSRSSRSRSRSPTGPTMDDVHFGYVYDFGAARGVGRRARAGRVPERRAARRRPARRSGSRSSRSRGRRRDAIAAAAPGDARRRATGCA